MSAAYQHLYGRFLLKVFTLLCILILLLNLINRPEYVSKKEAEEVSVETVTRRNIQSTETEKVETTKKILAWTKLFSRDFLIYYKHKVVASKAAFSQCPVYKDCEWTIEKSTIEDVDAVLFHLFPDDFSFTNLPAYRRPDQKWVVMNLESPMRFQGKTV